MNSETPLPMSPIKVIHVEKEQVMRAELFRLLLMERKCFDDWESLHKKTSI
jgi:hypothetical protein